jgi:CRISPR system Cascade subunit CasB
VGADTQRDVDAIERAFYTVAALIAAQPRTARDEDLGSDAAGDADTGDDATDGMAPTETPGSGTPHNGISSTPDSSTTDGSTGSTTQATAAASTTGFGPRRAPSLGRTVADGVRTGKLNEETTSARLQVLCRQDVAGLHRHLPRLVSHLRADLVPVDWVRLTVDLARWGRNGDQVAKGWLQDYYRRLAMPKGATPTTTGSGTADAAEDDTESELS